MNKETENTLIVEMLEEIRMISEGVHSAYLDLEGVADRLFGCQPETSGEALNGTCPQPDLPCLIEQMSNRFVDLKNSLSKLRREVNRITQIA